MKRDFKLFSIFFSVILFFACNSANSDRKESSNSQNNLSSELKKVRWMAHWYGEGKKELMIREMAREFSLTHQNIELSLEFPNKIFSNTAESELFIVESDSIAKMVQTNTWPWDIMLCDQERYKRAGEILGDMNWGASYLVDFSNELWFKAAHRDGLLESMNYKERYGGIMPGPLLEGVTNIMFASEVVEKKLGIKVNPLDMSLTEFVSYAQIVFDYNQSHSDKITFFSNQFKTASNSLFLQLVLSAYNKSEQPSREEALSAVEQTYLALEKLSKLKAYEQYSEFGSMTYDAAQRVLRHNDYLFVLQPSWMFLLWNNTNPEGIKQMQPCEIPSFDQKKAFAYSGFYQVIFVVPKNAPNVEIAKEFIKYISSKEIATTWIKYSKCPTGLKTNLSYTDFGQDKFEMYFRHLQNKYGNNQFDVDLSKFLFESDKTIEFHIDDVFLGKMSAEEAMADIKKQIR